MPTHWDLRLAGIVAVVLVAGCWLEARRDRAAGVDRGTILKTWVLVLLALVFLVAGMVGAHYAHARDVGGRWAAQDPALHDWFESLRSGRGPCCSDADGSAVSDVDWDTRDGHYRVRLEGHWIDVPAAAVLTVPNRVGRTMVWPIYYRSMGVLDRIEIRCFMPGSMT